MQKKTLYMALVVLALASLLLSACGNKDEDKKSEETKQSYRIAALVLIPGQATYFEGVKAGLAELGYVEGENVTYLYNGPTNTIDALQPEAEKLKSQNPDLIFTVGNVPTKTAQAVFAGTDVPIIFVPGLKPVDDGMVETIKNPGKHTTGIEAADTFGKALEWLLRLLPDTKRIYVPSASNESSSVSSVASLTEQADILGLELVIAEGATPEEIEVITKTIPDDVDAVFMVRSAGIQAHVSDMVQAATELQIPVVYANTGTLIDAGVMLGFGPENFAMGKQAARLGDQALKGADAGTLPVERADAFLAINLKSAEAIGVEIPDSILSQAHQIVRAES